MTAGVGRRGLLGGVVAGGVALPLLAGCGTESRTPRAKGELTAAADVPVGGGVILSERAVVVTQPTGGVFRCFSAVCTHQGCLVGSVQDGQIVCPCHQSHYSIEDGSVISGPAPEPLPEFPVEVRGGEVVSG